MRKLLSILASLAAGFTLALPAHAMLPFGGYPAFCTIVGACTDGDCIRIDGGGHFVLTKDQGRFYRAPTLEGPWQPLGSFSDVRKAEDHLANEGSDRIFGGILVENNFVMDAKGFHLYGVFSNQGKARPSDTYSMVSCNSYGGQRYARSGLQNLTCDFDTIKLTVKGTPEGGPKTPLAFQSDMGTVWPIMAERTGDVIVGTGKAGNDQHTLIVDRKGETLAATYTVVFGTGDFPAHFEGTCER